MSDGKIWFDQRLPDFLQVIQHVLDYIQHFPTAYDQHEPGGGTVQEPFLSRKSPSGAEGSGCARDM